MVGQTIAHYRVTARLGAGKELVYLAPDARSHDAADGPVRDAQAAQW